MKWTQMNRYQKRKLAFWLTLYLLGSFFFLGNAVRNILTEKAAIASEYEALLYELPETAPRMEELSRTAARVKTGIYVENIKNVSMRDSSFQVDFFAWFRWTGHEELTFLGDNLRVFNGVITKSEVIRDYQKEGLHYQEVRLTATVSKNFSTSGFPLGSQVLTFSLEPSVYPAEQVLLVPDTAGSAVNTNLSASGYSSIRSDMSRYLYRALNTMSNPALASPREVSGIVFCMEANRNSWGLFFQCFIALFGTVGWILITLYICAHHRVDPLHTLPPALFGAISNLIVDTNLLPDMVHFGLIEYMNLYGILIILAGTLSIIHINRIRDYRKDHAFADTYGRIMFLTILLLSILGMTILPLTTYRWR